METGKKTPKSATTPTAKQDPHTVRHDDVVGIEEELEYQMCHTILLLAGVAFGPCVWWDREEWQHGCLLLRTEPGGAGTMTWRSVCAFVLLVMIAASIGMAVAAVERSPGWIAHPGAATILRETWLALVVYAGAIVVVVANRGEEWDDELRNAALFGGIAGLVEVVNIALENGTTGRISSSVVPIAGMLVIFTLWGLAGARTARDLNHFRPGVIAAVMSAGVCVVIGVAAGFALELFIAPPRPDSIATWAEFKQSEWMDAHAFAIANTLQSGFTRLWMAPVIALVTGAAGAGIGKMRAGHQ